MRSIHLIHRAISIPMAMNSGSKKEMKSLSQNVVTANGKHHLASPDTNRIAPVTEQATEAIKTGELGFEPRLSDPESLVLPLHYSPSGQVGIKSVTKKIGQSMDFQAGQL